MVSKWTVGAVLLAVFAGFLLANSSEEGLPSWPMFKVGLLIGKGITWLDQHLTPPQVWIAKEMTGFATSKAMYIACELGVADILSQGSLSAPEIAKITGTDVNRTERVLKFLAVQGVFDRTAEGLYSNNVKSDYLRSDHPQSQQAFCLHMGNEATESLQKYLEALYDPALNPMKAAYNTDKEIWEFYDDPANAKLRANFDKSMLSMSQAEIPTIVADFPWNKYHNATVVDVGGGIGHITAGILRKNPTFRGVLYELDKAIESAKTVLSAQYPDIYPRMSLVSGDFFVSVPPGGDFYLLKYIIHDYTDDQAIRLLTNVATALQHTHKSSSQRASLLIIEKVYEYPPDSVAVALIDILLLGVQGRERSIAEYQAILKKSGLKLVTIHPTRSPLSILECQVV